MSPEPAGGPAFAFTLPGLPPPLNHVYTERGRGGRCLTAEAAAWQAGATLAIRAASATAGWAVPAGTLLAVAVRLTDPRVMTWDVDGRLKLLLDALAMATGIDDRYIMRLEVSKARGPAAVAGRVQALPRARA